MKNELEALSAGFLPAIEAEMREVLQADNQGYLGEPPGDRPDYFYGMMHYHMGWVDKTLNPVASNSGKRIRPVLSLLSCSAMGGDWHQAIPVAAAIEILHNFSLVHDDIQDESPTRRGRATVWTLWGQPQAINTGDAMFAMAHLALSRLEKRQVPADIIVRSYRRFDETCVALTRGQYTDMDFETRDRVEVAEYKEMITGKTAALLALCCELGGLVGGGDEKQVNHLAQFGLELGLAFQIHDDILGIWGDESLTGKSAATDIITRKKTLPVLFGLEESPSLRALYQHEDVSQTFVSQAVALLDEVNARQHSESLVKSYSDSALAHLRAANPAGPAANALYGLSDMLLHRDH